MTQQGARSGRRAAFVTMISSSAVPYGFTISIWSSGALLTHFRGMPGVGEVFLFAGGGLAGFSVLGLVAQAGILGAPAVDDSGAQVLTGILDWLAVGASLGAVSLVAEIPGSVAWLLGTFVATTVYLVAGSLQLAWAVERRSATPPRNHPGTGGRQAGS
jgi:hypothetical protein